jgi:pimeloyl-ACP methyl ester carboxylesterase
MPHVDDIYYELHGSGPGLPAVLVMGLAMDAHAWEEILPRLADGRRVVILDNRGAGRSKKPPGPYTIGEMAGDVAAVLDAAGIARAHVVGTSLGGAIAQELALSHARRVKSLALLCTFEKISRGGSDMMGAPAAASAVEPKMLFRFLSSLVFTPQFLEREKARLRAIFERSMSYGFSVPPVFAQLEAAYGHDTTARLATIGAPTIVITGTDDRLVPPRHSRTIAAGIPGARLVELEGAPHALVLERAEEIAAILSEWLAAHD